MAKAGQPTSAVEERGRTRQHSRRGRGCLWRLHGGRRRDNGQWWTIRGLVLSFHLQRDEAQPKNTSCCGVTWPLTARHVQSRSLSIAPPEAPHPHCRQWQAHHSRTPAPSSEYACSHSAYNQKPHRAHQPWQELLKSQGPFPVSTSASPLSQNRLHPTSSPSSSIHRIADRLPGHPVHSSASPASVSRHLVVSPRRPTIFSLGDGSTEKITTTTKTTVF